MDVVARILLCNLDDLFELGDRHSSARTAKPDGEHVFLLLFYQTARLECIEIDLTGPSLNNRINADLVLLILDKFIYHSSHLRS